jgi:hypothetical protein
VIYSDELGDALLEREHFGAERVVVGAVPAEVAAAQDARYCLNFQFVDQVISRAWHGSS